ncbi:MAG: amidase family protein [Deltaproteobacteria bacterium]|nr:amidase family protein [Deltaproteobacteria bacterium]
MLQEYCSLDGLELATLVNRGEVSAAELLEEAIGLAEKRNPALNALVYRFYDRARQAAAGHRPSNRPFDGVPLLLKDVLGDCEGVPTRFASRYVPEFPAIQDSELVRRFKAAGFIAFAKTNAPEFGLPPFTEPQLYGPARNPWDLSRTPGGSSGGAAAAVAAGIVPVAHANDGGGSIRIPAACCGLVGLKPTRARNSLAPQLGDFMSGLVIEHVLSRTVRDSAAALDATEGWVPGDPYVAPAKQRPYLEEAATPPRRLRIAFSTASPSGPPVEPEIAQACVKAAELLASLGHQVVERQPEIRLEDVAPHFMTIYASGLAATIEAIRALTGREPGPDGLEAMTLNLYELGRQVTAAQYLLAVQVLQQLSRQVAAFFETYDLLLTPTLGTPQLSVGAIDVTSPTANLMDEKILRFAHLNPLYNITGQPAISLPLYQSAAGLPIGMLFAARYGDEATLFQLAGQLEQALPWKGRKPPVWG